MMGIPPMKLHPRRPFRTESDLDQNRRAFYDAEMHWRLRDEACAKLVVIVFYFNELTAIDSVVALPILIP
jgi:hypothetical protein